jgi:protoporphyrinogen oxidase
MKVGIIGAGFTGLSAAYYLLKDGHEVTVFEKDAYPGGLAIGFSNPKWKWTLEKHYHHWFTNDESVLELAKEINFPVIIKRPKTSVYVGNDIFQLDSPIALLKFQKLPLLDRVRMGFVLAFLRFNPFWKVLEKYNTVDFLKKTMGRKGYEMIWEPQLKNKFGGMADTISLAWFWARIKKRTPSLAYPKGGFLEFSNKLSDKVKKMGGTIHFKTEIEEIKSDGKVRIKVGGKEQEFDKVIVTLPSFFFFRIAPSLPQEYTKKYSNLKGLGAINVVLRLKEPFLSDGAYWLSVCEKDSPIMAVVEHTNFMEKGNYNNEHLVYLGNYLPKDHKYFSMEGEEILKIYDSFLKKLNPDYKKSLIGIEVFKVPFAQPIIPVNYSAMIPPFDTPLPNVYLSNMQQVYPWDRGTNYAVEFGKKVANYIERDEI